jgi:hypothetical protein
MSKRSLFYSFIIALALTFLGIFFFDRPIAAFVERVGGSQSFILRKGTDWLEVASFYRIGKFFIGFLLLGAGALCFSGNRLGALPGCLRS